jgi:hypothetical protein
MKKKNRKLVLRSETIRTLEGKELAHALGGGDSPNAAAGGTDRTETGINCVAQAAVVVPK